MNVNDWLLESSFYLDTRICRPSTGRRCFPLGFACCRTTAAPLLSVVAVVRLPEGIEGLGVNPLRDEEVVEKGDGGLKVDSVCSVWPGAEWMEREVYDMLGVIFVGH